MKPTVTYTTSISPDRWRELATLKQKAIIENPTGFSQDAHQLAEYSEDDWRKQFASDSGKIMVFAEVDAKIVGFGSVRLFQQERMRHNAVLDDLYVDTLWRGQGIGSGLVSKRIELVTRQKEISQVFCEVISSQTESIEVHIRLGFEETGRIKDFMQVDGHYYDSVFLQKKV